MPKPNHNLIVTLALKPHFELVCMSSLGPHKYSRMPVSGLPKQEHTHRAVVVERLK